VTRTLTYVDDGEGPKGSRALVSAPQLLLAIDCSNPRERPARFSLAAVDEVMLGRGPERNRIRVREGSRRRLRIHVPDGFMSSRHVRLFQERGWHAEDAGSKNGTFLAAERLGRARLHDGDLLIAGNTIFVFREAMEQFADEIDQDLGGTSLVQAPITTLNAALADELARLMRVAPSTVPVLIHGETGTGKELVARAVHDRSGRSGALVAVNCGALPATLITSELFGARKGAYSGAMENRTGLVRAADGGTLFLDEIAELPLSAQAALLRVLQEGEVVPVGGNAPLAIDVRMIAATHRDLPSLVASGAFREDLFARVAGHAVTLPPLRERREDIGLVVGTLLERGGYRSARFTPDAARALLTYSWPRNVRELEHALKSAIAVAGSEPIAPSHLPEPVRTARRVAGEPESEGRFLDLVREHDGNVSAVARALGTSRSQVRRIASRLQVDLADLRRRRLDG
jgi:transcriptional regulator with PAS, ATPase and Fis domain